MLTARSILTFVARFVYHTFKACQILFSLYITTAVLIVTGHSSFVLTCLAILLVTTVAVYVMSFMSASKLGLVFKAAHGIICVAILGVFMAVTKAVSTSQVLILALGAIVVLISGLFVGRRIGFIIINAYALLLMAWVGMYVYMQDFGVDEIIVALMAPVMVEGVIAYLYILVKSSLVATPQLTAS